MIVALGDPRPITQSVLGFAPDPSPPTRHTVLLLDTSASMATFESGVSRFDDAIDRAHSVVDQLATNPEHRLMVAAAGRHLTPLTLWTRSAETAHEALERAQARGPGDQSLEVGGVSATVRTILAGREGAQAVLFTDGAFETGDEALPFEAERVGEATDNVSIEAFNVRPALDGSTSYAILAAVRNHMNRPVEATLHLYAHDQGRAIKDFVSDQHIVSSHAMTLPANGVHREVLTDVLFTGDRLAARVVLHPESNVVDGLDRDDVAVALVPPRRPLRVQLVGDENLFLSASFLTLEGVELDVRSASDYRGPQGYDVSVIYRSAVDLSRPGNYLLIDPPPGDVVAHRGSISRPQVGRVRGDHPITRGLHVVDAAIERATRVVTERGDRSLVTDSSGAPLIFTREHDARRFVVLTFAPEESLLPLRYAFPLLMVQTLSWFSPQAQGLVPTRRAGAALSIASALPEGPLELLGPAGGGSDHPRRIGDRVHFVGERVGVYELRHGDGDRELVALNLMDPQESRIDPRATLDAYSRPPPWSPQAPPWPGSPWRLIIVLAGGLLMLEWWTWHRRITA